MVACVERVCMSRVKAREKAIDIWRSRSLALRASVELEIGVICSGMVRRSRLLFVVHVIGFMGGYRLATT
jgi:hypothetical protein